MASLTKEKIKTIVKNEDEWGNIIIHERMQDTDTSILLFHELVYDSRVAAYEVKEVFNPILLYTANCEIWDVREGVFKIVARFTMKGSSWVIVKTDGTEYVFPFNGEPDYRVLEKAELIFAIHFFQENIK